MGEGVSFKYECVECVCVSFKGLSKEIFNVLVVVVRLVESGVFVVSVCVVEFISYVVGVSIIIIIIIINIICY